MKLQIVYVLVANEKNLYLEEMWVSLYSLRQFHPDIKVNVLVDEDTEKMVMARFELLKLIDELIVVPTPEGYNAKQRSRQIKTKVREVIKGVYIFIDTDTVICKPLFNENETLCYENENSGFIYAVPDGHLPLNECLFPPMGEVKRIFDADCSDSKFWFNSGVMFVRDTPEAHEFYKRWNENWTYSCFEKGNSQDQPALLKTDKEFGYVIKELPGIYNAQVAMSLKYFADAVILHWWHMDFIENQDYSPYFSLQIYKDVKTAGGITPKTAEQIVNAKQSFISPTMPVGKEHILFLFSPAGKIYNKIYKEGGAASAIMLKIAGWLEKLHRYTKKDNCPTDNNDLQRYL